jgi:acyl-CoA thioesterase I
MIAVRRRDTPTWTGRELRHDQFGGRMKLRNIATLAAFFITAFIVNPGPALAQVVALGASDTAGKGLPSQQAYPAQLEVMLRAKGYHVSVANEGISGDPTQGMYARLDSAVPQGTRVVILQPGNNDMRLGKASAVPQILAALRARKIPVVMLPNSMLRFPREMRQADGMHLTPEGYRILASRILPKVVAALGSKH